MLWEVEELKNISEIQPKMIENALKNLWENNPELLTRKKLWVKK